MLWWVCMVKLPSIFCSTSWEQIQSKLEAILQLYLDSSVHSWGEHQPWQCCHSCALQLLSVVTNQLLVSEKVLFIFLCMWYQPFNNTYLSLVGWNRGYLSRSTTCSKWRLDAIWWFEKQNILLLDRMPLLRILVAMLLKYKWCLLNGKTCQTTLMSVSLSLY